MINIFKLGVGIILGIVLMAFVFGSPRVVQPEHVAMKKTFGKTNTEYLEPGLHFKWPIVSQIIPIKISQNTKSEQTEATSADIQAIQLNYSIMYRIKPEEVYTLFTQYSGGDHEIWYDKLIAPRAEEISKQVTAKYRAEELIKKRIECKSEMLKLLKESVTNLEVVDLTINNIQLSPELNKSIEAKMIADQTAQAKEYELIQAKKQAEIIEVEAIAKADALRITAEAIEKNPAVTVIEGIKKWNGTLPTTLVVNGSSGGTSGTASNTSILLPAK